MKRRPRVLIADDHPIVAEALATSLGRWFRIVGAVTTVDRLATQIGAKAPDILLLDLTFGAASALEVLPALLQHYPGIRIVILTAHAESVLADAALRAGASAYVVKQSTSSELHMAIDEALAGRTYVSRAARALGAARASPRPDRRRHAPCARATP